MKVGGKSVTAPSLDFIVLPREGGDLVFYAQALPDMDMFNKLCPEPKVPGKLTPAGYEPMPDEPGYKAILTAHLKQKVAYIVIFSLKPSNIEWDTVIEDNPKTWVNWQEDLKNGGMLQREIDLVGNLVMEANYLTEAKLIRAREAFLLGRALEPKSSSFPDTEPQTSQSGEPVTVSE